MASITDTRHQLARCWHAICYSMAQTENVFTDDTLARLWSYCGGFFREFAGTIEGILTGLIKAKHDKVGQQFEEQLRDAWRKYAKGGEDFGSLEKMTLGHLMQSVVYWNRMYEDRIGNSGLDETLSILQSYGLAEFRDCFSHAPATTTGTTSAIKKHLSSKKGARRLLGSIERGFRFVLDMKYPSYMSYLE